MLSAPPFVSARTEHMKACIEVYKTLLQNPHITQSVMVIAEEMVKEKRTTHDDTFKEMKIEVFHKLMTQQAVRHVDMFTKNYREIHMPIDEQRIKEKKQI